MAKADFPNTDIRSIITGVAKLFNLNVVVPDTLTGTTTLQLHDVSWQTIYKIVLDQVGYAYTVDSTSGPTPIILIKNKADVAAEPMETPDSPGRFRQGRRIGQVAGGVPRHHLETAGNHQPRHPHQHPHRHRPPGKNEQFAGSH